jgi:EAL domain-containing protein (putative c-di-GMP-specific phosphodiesterase class I)
MDALLRDVRSAHLPHGKLCFEITETAAIEHLDIAAEVIGAFRSFGCGFSLDDFGSGLCSFGYLQSLPVDEVKIDGRFIRDVAQSGVSQEIVRAIHQVAHATGKRTVAEFVDDPRKLRALRNIGVDYAQGWLFYPTVTPEKFVELLST